MSRSHKSNGTIFNARRQKYDMFMDPKRANGNGNDKRRRKKNVQRTNKKKSPLQLVPICRPVCFSAAATLNAQVMFVLMYNECWWILVLHLQSCTLISMFIFFFVLFSVTFDSFSRFRWFFFGSQFDLNGLNKDTVIEYGYNCHYFVNLFSSSSVNAIQILLNYSERVMFWKEFIKFKNSGAVKLLAWFSNILSIIGSNARSIENGSKTKNRKYSAIMWVFHIQTHEPSI